MSDNLTVLGLEESQVAFSRSYLRGLEDPQVSSVPCRAKGCSNSLNSVLQIFIEDLLCTRHRARDRGSVRDELDLAFALAGFTDQWARHTRVPLTAIQQR